MFSPMLRITGCLFTSVQNLCIILTIGFWRRVLVRCSFYGKYPVKFLTFRKGSEERAGSQCHDVDTVILSFQLWSTSKCYKWSNCLVFNGISCGSRTFPCWPCYCLLDIVVGKTWRCWVKGNRKPTTVAVRIAVQHLKVGRKRLPVAFKWALVGSPVRPLSILDQYYSRVTWLMSAYIFPSLLK